MVRPNYAPMVQHYVNVHRRGVKRKERDEGHVFITREEAAEMIDIAKEPTKGEQCLDSLHQMLELLDEVFEERSPIQRQCHMEYIRTCLPKVVGVKEFAKRKVYYLERMNCIRHHMNVFLRAPRRFGKTYALSMFVAAVLLSVPNVKIAIFAQGGRQSKALLGYVQDIILSVPGAEERVVKPYSKEWITVKGDSPTDVRKAVSYPSSVQVIFMFSCRFACARARASRSGDRRHDVCLRVCIRLAMR